MAELVLLSFDRAEIVQLHCAAQGANLAILKHLRLMAELPQPPTGNSSFSRIALSGSSRGNSGCRLG